MKRLDLWLDHWTVTIMGFAFLLAAIINFMERHYFPTAVDTLFVILAGYATYTREMRS